MQFFYINSKFFNFKSPLRGLFLRNYLLMSIRAVLPDVSHVTEEGSGESESGTVTNSISILLKNFGEMNKLWVRRG